MMLFLYLFLCNTIVTVFSTRFVVNISTKNILEKYCQNYPSLKLMSNSMDGLWQVKDGLIFIGGNYFSKINQIRKNYFPEVSDQFPKIITEDIKAMIPKAKKHPNFLFEDYIYASVDRNELYLMGFNQIWFDCPQSLCIDAGLDAITNDANGNLLLFRGKHYWQLSVNTTVKVSNAKLITKSFDGIPAHLDAVTENIDKQITYFFKENNIWIFENDSSVIKKKISDIFVSGPDNINAAMYVKTDYNEALTFMFRGIQYWAYDMGNNKDPPYNILSGFPHFVTNIHISFPKSIDACYMDQNSKNLLFFKRWMYYSFPLESLLNSAVQSKDLNKKFSFIDVFKCDKNDYKKWELNSYENFIEDFGNRSEKFVPKIEKTDPTDKPVSSSTHIKNNVSKHTESPVRSEGEKNGITFIVIIIGIIIFFIALISLNFMGFVNYKNRKSKTKKSSDSGRKTMTSKSAISDLPSRGLQSIVIETDELKPLKSEVFAWKSTVPKANKKNSVKITQKPKNTVNERKHKSPVITPIKTTRSPKIDGKDNIKQTIKQD